MAKPYVIHNWDSPVLPWPSGGARALKELRKELEARGHEVRWQWENPKDDHIWLWSESRAKEALQHHAPNKCYFFGNKEIKPIVPQDALRFVWNKQISDDPILNVNIFELDLWKPYNNKVKGRVAYWVGKGRHDSRIIPDNAVEITRQNFKKRNELAKFISSCEYLISFDPMTAVVTEATFTNTPVLIWNTGNEPGQPEWNREEVEATGWVKNGVAWNKEEMEFARDTVHLAKDDYLELMKTFPATIDNFIKLTQDKFAD